MKVVHLYIYISLIFMLYYVIFIRAMASSSFCLQTSLKRSKHLTPIIHQQISENIPCQPFHFLSIWMKIVVPQRFTNIWLTYMRDMNKNSYIKPFSITPLVLWETALDNHCPKPLRSEKVLRLDFAIEEGTTRPSLICLTIEGTVWWPCLHRWRYGKWQFDGACHIPHVCACQMCSTLIQTIWHHPTCPTDHQFMKKNQMMNQKNISTSFINCH